MIHRGGENRVKMRVVVLRDLRGRAREPAERR